MHGFAFDVAHMLAGGLVLVSFVMLYQDRLYALINVLALHALVLALSVAWQAYIQHAPHLYITAAIALGFKAIVIPWALRRMVFRLGIHREIETVVSIGLTMLAGIGLVALSLMVMLPVTAHADPVAREDIAMALSVVLIGLLMMVTRRNAVSQVAGFLSLENGVNLAATGAQGMPLVVEISVAFSILIAFIVIGIFLFRIRERFDTVDLQALDQFRGSGVRSAARLIPPPCGGGLGARRGACSGHPPPSPLPQGRGAVTTAPPVPLAAAVLALICGLSALGTDQCRRQSAVVSLRAAAAGRSARHRASSCWSMT